MSTRGIAASAKGSQRPANEDVFHCDDALGLYIVCDGIGGGAAGEVAAAMAVSTIVATIAAHDLAATPLSELVRSAIHEASRAIYETAGADPQLGGMGCTATVLLVSGERAALGHVGHSRLYLLRHAELHQLSVDHTVADELLRRGMLTVAETIQSPFRRSLSRAVGLQEAVQVDTLDLDVLRDDRFLICSNGLFGISQDDDWVVEALGADDLTHSARRLMQGAVVRGASDDMTAVIVETVQAGTSRTRLLEARTEFIRREPLFAGLPMTEAVRILDLVTVRDHEPGEVVVAAAQRFDRMVWVHAGRMEVIDGERVVGAVEPGERTGLTALLRPGPAALTLRAQTRTCVVSLAHQRFTALCRRRPILGVKLLERVARELCDSL